jgi:hypothetical protein
MPLLAVGTTNPGKVAAVRDALASYPALSGANALVCSFPAKFSLSAPALVVAFIADPDVASIVRAFRS